MYYSSFGPSLQSEVESRVAQLENPNYQATATSFRPLTHLDWVAMAILAIALPLILVALSLAGL